MNIKVKKGLDLPIGGVPERHIVDLRTAIDRYAVRPSDVVGFTPRLLVSEGDKVEAGQPLVEDKHDARLTLPSPVAGTVEAIVRGEKRRLMEVRVKRCDEQKAPANQAEDYPTSIYESPCWWMLRERPYGTIANRDHHPKGIFISMLDTNPLAPDLHYAMQGRGHDFEEGLRVLASLAPVHLCVPKGWPFSTNVPNCFIHTVEGPHPAGNIGTQVAEISPISKGECVWTILAQDVATLGLWSTSGDYRPERVVAVGGPAARAPHYYRMICGGCLSMVSQAQLMNPVYPAMTDGTPAGTRMVTGSPLSGSTVVPDGYLGMYDQQVCLLPEGDQYEFMGWLMPGLNKFSFSRTFLSGLLRPFSSMEPLKSLHTNYTFNTNTHGSVRPFLFTGQFEQVFPLDIYPLQLIKACIVGDMELQEKLGIYEVEPEDFALCEYIDPSKTEIQTIIREALETLRKEATA